MAFFLLFGWLTFILGASVYPSRNFLKRRTPPPLKARGEFTYRSVPEPTYGFLPHKINNRSGGIHRDYCHGCPKRQKARVNFIGDAAKRPPKFADKLVFVKQIYTKCASRNAVYPRPVLRLSAARPFKKFDCSNVPGNTPIPVQRRIHERSFNMSCQF